MVTTLTSRDSAQVNSLVSDAFGYLAPASFFQDFPVWDLRISSRLADPGRLRSFGILRDGKLVSHVGCRIVDSADLKNANGNALKIGMIGAVATASGFRGQGFSSQLMEVALSHLDNEKCDLCLLWGSEHDFYSKFGFGLGGNQTRVMLRDFLRASESNSKVAISIEKISETIFHDLKSRNFGVRISDLDRPWIFAHQTIEWWLTREPFGYVGYGRGMDLKHIVHEFGGSREAVVGILKQIYAKEPLASIIGRSQDLKALCLLSPGAKTPSDWIEEQLALIRPSKSSYSEQLWVSGISSC